LNAERQAIDVEESLLYGIPYPSLNNSGSYRFLAIWWAECRIDDYCCSWLNPGDLTLAFPYLA